MSETYAEGCQCGAPLSLDSRKDGQFYIAIATMDDYSEFAPVFQSGIESRRDFVQELHALPAFVSGMNETGATPFAMLLPDIEASKRQHPDNDTENWITGEK